ncbi:hypothetical protein Tco_0155143 [Tanacetum coccineum]
MKRVAKTIELMGDVAKINDPQYELLLLRSYAGISKLYFVMRTCSPHVFERAQLSFDTDLRFALERIITACEPRFGVLLFFVLKRCSTCSRVFVGDIYGDHVVSCVGIVGLDACVDLIGFSPLMQTGMADFVHGRTVIDAAKRKRVKYEAKCANIGYGFLPFSFSSFGELEEDVIALLKRIRKFSVTQDIEARAVVHIFSRVTFAIARGSAIKRQCQEESIVNAIRSWSLPGGSLQVMRETLAESSPLLSDVDEEDIDMGERNIKQCKRKICDGHYTAVVRVLSSSGVAPYNDATLEDLKIKHPFKPPPSLPHIFIDHHHLVASTSVVLDRIKSFPCGTSCGWDGLRAQHLMDCLSGAAVAIFDELVSSITQVVNLFLDGKCPNRLGEYIASAPLTPLVKPGGGIRPIAVDGLQFGVGVAGGSKAIFHSVNRLIEACGDDVGYSMLLVDFKNAFNLVDREVMLREVRLCCPAISSWVEFCYSSPARLYYGEHILWSCQGVQQGDPLGPLLFSLVLHPLICKIRDSFSLSLHAWYLDDGTIVGDIVVVGKVLELIMEDGPGCVLHLNVDKTEVFWPKEDPRSRLAGIFPPNIARPLLGVKLLGGPASVNFDFCNELVMKRVAKTIGLMDVIAKINDPQCELLLLRSCAGISRLYFTMRTCPPRVFESAQRSFDVALRSSLERIVTASGPGFGDWQWRLATLPFSFGGLGVYSAGDVLNYAFLASRLQSAGLQTKLLRHTGIVSHGPIFDDALSVFNASIETDLLSKDSCPQTREENGRYIFHTGIPLFSVSKPCSRVFAGDIYGDHVVSCAGIIGIKHRYNVVRDTLVDICYRSGISAGKEVDIGLDGGRDKPLRPTDMLLYSWDGGLDVCVDLTGSSPLTQTWMIDFVPGRAVMAVIDAAQRKRGKYMAKCAAIGYGFIPFSFSSLGELEADAVTLLKRIRKFSMAQDIGARAAVHIFNRILLLKWWGPR